MSFRIRFGEAGKQLDHPADGGPPTIIRLQQFEVEGDSRRFYVNTVVAGTDAARLFRSSGSELDEARLNEALAFHTLPAIEAALRDGSLDGFGEPDAPQQFTIRLEREQLAAAAALHDAKVCRYRVRARGDDYCDAGILRGVPTRLATSRAICTACDAADARLVCSNLHHLMTASTSSTMGTSITVVGFECDLGKPEAQPNQCTFGRLACWEHHVQIEPPDAAAPLPPLAIHESVDYLDSVWRNAFGAPLLKMSVLAPGGVLATPCTGAQDFQAKLSALGEVFNALHVDHQAKGKSGSLANMSDFLRLWGEEKGAAPEEVAEMERSIHVLQQTLRLRAGQQHGPARDRFEQVVRALGLSLPATSYADEWNRLQAKIHGAFAGIRQFIRERA